MTLRQKSLLGASALCAAALTLLMELAPVAPRPAQAATRRPPNVIVILADDLGHNDLSLNGNPLVKTPNIDALAREGVTFATGYSGDAVCAPSRAALLTGRDPQRFGFEFLPHEEGFARNVAALGGSNTGGVGATTGQTLMKDEAPDEEIPYGHGGQMAPRRLAWA